LAVSLSPETNIQIVLDEAARICAECLNVPFCKICRYRPEENDLLIEAGVGWNAGVVGQVVSRADMSSPQGRAFITGNPVICVNLAKEPSLILPNFYKAHQIVSTLDVVIRSGDKPYGILEVDSPREHFYDQHDIDFLTGFTNILAEGVQAAKRRKIEIDESEDKDRLLEMQRTLLEEKTVLARELNHRVRNNLQLVYGMLDRQLQITKGKEQSRGISEIARRIMALAQVYEHLLGIGLSNTIDFGEYLLALCPGIAEVEKTEHPNITITCHCDRVTLDLDAVTSLGLVVTELIANSFEHAFPDGKGSINVSLTGGRLDEMVTLIISDDGTGFAHRDDAKSNGLKLVKRVMQQVGGSATLSSDNGAKWVLNVPTPHRATG
jgi:two-component sensor histidine kinase